MAKLLTRIDLDDLDLAASADDETVAPGGRSHAKAGGGRTPEKAELVKLRFFVGLSIPERGAGDGLVRIDGKAALGLLPGLALCRTDAGRHTDHSAVRKVLQGAARSADEDVARILARQHRHDREPCRQHGRHSLTEWTATSIGSPAARPRSPW